MSDSLVSGDVFSYLDEDLDGEPVVRWVVFVRELKGRKHRYVFQDLFDGHFIKTSDVPFSPGSIAYRFNMFDEAEKGNFDYKKGGFDFV